MIRFFIIGVFTCLAHSFFSQSSFSDIQFWVGNGPDSAMLVVDFIDDTSDPSYAWGFLFDASTDVLASDMLSAISDAESTLDIAIGGGFLNDINYNSHSGTGGAPNYWATWSQDVGGEWELNSGIGETLVNGLRFGCTYTDFDPALAPSPDYPAYYSQNFLAEEIEYWVGDGQNSALLILDFVDDLNYGIPVRYAWGYKFDGETTAEQMLIDVSNSDINLDVVLDGEFLNDIIYNDQAGIAGNPHYWGTFSGTNLSNWTLNSGISENLVDGSWFGCSYGEWEPPRPYTPLPAIDPSSLTFGDITSWTGNGADSCAVVIDFEDGSGLQSFVFGYLFDNTTTGSQALQDLDEMFENMDVSIGSGFLNDITYDSFIGIGGNPNYWATWSAPNVGGWFLNSGIGEQLNNGDWFGCSYTNWDPANPPSLPGNVITSIDEISQSKLNVYPNPTNGILNISSEIDFTRIIIYNAIGSEVAEYSTVSNGTIDLQALPDGLYSLAIETKNARLTKKIIKN